MTARIPKLPKGGRVPRRYYKRAVNRARRRAERRSPEDAPVRLRELVRGWVD